MIDALDLDSGIKPDKEYEFKYTAPESGDYRFYLFRGSTQPIIIKWIYIQEIDMIHSKRYILMRNPL